MKRAIASLSIAALGLGPLGTAHAQSVGIAYTFGDSFYTDYPQGNLLFINGSFYGESVFGGAYQLSPPTQTQPAWVITRLGGPVGDPAAGLAAGPGGVLYGTEGYIDEGATIFSMTPPAQPGGAWTTTTLYTVPNGVAATSLGSVYRSPAGVLYGTFEQYTNEAGIVYSLTPPAAGQTAWTFAVVHAFGGPGDGVNPDGGVIGLRNGTLVGTTLSGGHRDRGTVFALTPPAVPGGAWTENILYSFQKSPDGAEPTCTLAQDASGALYGTTQEEGSIGEGIIFKLTPPPTGHGSWIETILSNRVQFPLYGVTFSGSNIFATSNGGVTELTPDPANPGQFVSTETPGPSNDSPASALLKVGSKYLFGVYTYGGANSDGALYYALQ